MFEGPLYQTIDPPKKFPTLSFMKRAWIVLAGLAAACTGVPVPSTPGQSTGGPLLELRKSFTCPLPPSRGLITIARDGKAERVLFDGLDPELGQTKFTRDVLELSPKDAADLFQVVADSDWRDIPEDADASALKGCADCCSGALLIKTGEGGRSLRYAGNKKPPKLEALMKGIDGILARGTWTRALYPWEKKP